MKWFTGQIAEAINLAKTNNAIFVVYIEGQDENSKILTNYINSESITSKLESNAFVAIRIESDKPEYMQFCNIYQIVPIPSLFFIKNGIPIKIVTSVIKSADEMVAAIDEIIKSEGLEGLAATITPTNVEAKSSKDDDNKATVSKEEEKLTTVESEIVCEGGVCYKRSAEEVEKPKEESVKEETEEEKQEKIKRALKLIEEKRIEKIKEEERLEKEREIRRRKEGQEIQKLKKWQDEQELQQLKDERKREKMEAMEARRRVLEQIEDDKKERARRFNSLPLNESTPSTQKAEQSSPITPPVTITPPNSARIQFKKPDGDTEIVTFDSTIPFADLHAFVKNDILSGTNINDFTLATTFPRRQFSQVDFDKTLIDLNLAPTSVVLIIPLKKTSSVLPVQSDGSLFNMISAIVMGLFTPVFALFAYLKNFIIRPPPAVKKNNDAGEFVDVGKRKRDEEVLPANDAAKKRNMSAFGGGILQTDEPSTSTSASGAIPKSGAYKRTSNIHRLHQDSDDEDEERKTYNGNSTQQL